VYHWVSQVECDVSHIHPGRMFFVRPYKCQQKKCGQSRVPRGFQAWTPSDSPSAAIGLRLLYAHCVSPVRRLSESCESTMTRFIQPPFKPRSSSSAAKNRERNDRDRRIFEGKKAANRNIGGEYVLQSMWCICWNAAALSQLWSGRQHGRSRAASSSCAAARLLQHGAAACYAHRQASTYPRHFVDRFRRLLHFELVACAALSSHGHGTWQMDVWLRYVDDVTLPSRWMAPPLHRYHRDCTSPVVVGRRLRVVDPPALGTCFRHRDRRADFAQANPGHDPGDLYPVGPAGEFCGSELRPAFRGTSRLSTARSTPLVGQSSFPSLAAFARGGTFDSALRSAPRQIAWPQVNLV
jgi:hypothetical protein